MLKIIKKIIFILALFILFYSTKVNAEINDSSLQRNYYHGYYAVYNAPDRVRLFDAERFTLNGDTAYCIEPGTAITTSTYSSTTDWSITGLSTDVRNYIRLVAYYGYDYANHQTMYYYFATQELIWEKVSGRAVGWILGEDRYGPQLDIESEKNEILNLINKHYQTPSFDEDTIDLTLGESTEIEDTNNVLSNYEIYSTSLENVSIDNNKLVIGEQSSTNDGDIQLVKKNYTSKVNLIYYNGSSQKLIRYGVLDPVLSVVNVNVIGGHITIAKQDKETGINAQGNAILNGAKYNIYNSENNVVDTLTIGIKETSIELPVGNYTIKEVESPKGYKLDNNTYYFTIDKNNVDINLTFYDEVIKVNYNIFKVFANENTVELTGEPNITFDFYLKSKNELYKSAITDETGHLSINLPYGKYLVKQVNTTPNYEKVKDFEITIDENTASVVNKLISDALIKAKLKVVKIDSETGKVIAREGIKFKIKNTDNNTYVCQDITYPTTNRVCEFETDNTGTMITPYPLVAGNYQLEEVENQKVIGYTWNRTPLKFSINENSNLKEENDELVLEMKFSNTQVKGSIEINKIGEKVVISDNGITYEDIKMNDVIFRLYANEDIYSQDGTKMYSKDDIVRTLTTVDGKAKTNNLYLGNYCLVEISTNDNYVLDETPKCFELKYKDQYTSVVKLVYTYKNYLTKGDFELTKTDVSTSEPLPNTLIEVYTDNNEKIFSDTTNNEGKIILEKIPIGKYYFIEKKAPESYVLNNNKHYFEIKENNEVVKSTLTNEKIKGDFELTKTDVSTSEPLPNTLIEVYTKDDELVFSNRTNEEGKITIKDLVYGKYYFIEKEAPEGYVLNSEKHDFEIKENGKVVKSTLTNEKIKGDFELTKTDVSTSEPLPNTLIEIYNINNDLVYSKKTNNNGRITIKDLVYGKYYFIEKEAPDGYILNDEKHNFEIKTNGEIVKSTLTNEKIKGDFELTKTDVSTSEPLPNTLIEVYTEDDELVFSDRTNEDGKITIKDLVYGKYYFIEKEAPKGYVLNNDKHNFEIKTNGEVVKSELTNKLIYGSLEFTKVDFSTSEPLPNTLIQIYNEQDELIFEDKTDEDGKIVIEELPYGKYYIIEKEAPEGYILNEEKMPFEILEDGEIVKVTMTNEKIVEVPNTIKYDYIIEIIYAVIGIGVVLIIYGLFKSKKK